MADSSITAEFRLDEDTKNTRRYEEITVVEQKGETMEVPAEGLGQHTIETLYIQQESLQEAFSELPDRVQVEIAASSSS